MFVFQRHLFATPSGSCVKLLREITCHLGLLLITRGGFFGNALHIVARPGTRERICGPSGILFEAYRGEEEEGDTTIVLDTLEI